MRNRTWKKLSSKVVLQNPWFKIRVDKVVRPDGKPGEYNIVETRGPAVYIIALTDQREVVLIEQFRYTTQNWSWEIPAGNSDGQPILQAAKRELWEETGLVAKHWKKIGKFFGMHGICSEDDYVFLAEKLIQSKDDKQREEGITRVKTVPFKRLLKLVKEGKITDAQTMAAVIQAGLYLGFIKS